MKTNHHNNRKASKPTDPKGPKYRQGPGHTYRLTGQGAIQAIHTRRAAYPEGTPSKNARQALFQALGVANDSRPGIQSRRGAPLRPIPAYRLGLFGGF